ncbi:uncharacterized protein AB675_510 [Cyphellophora attinorum]|uniref:Uncharacterized protein n=1 Tax=Cyphellophora attinorum TaxID=1664694 RepID=A0A0N1HB46_9EURO|nr:uncharacterized protein AB675_510 [Phialophora attinorum]KPI45626.1 hypothetical protein AB675_510 [Phialophora attinorum]
MAPIRRYLRISRHSVLECRIFLENHADRDRWLLNPQDPALNRIFEAVKPYVLPKLREENERVKSKGKKKKSIKDVIVKDDFQVAVFLTEATTRHALMIKNKTFEDREPIKSNSSKMLDADRAPVTIADESDDDDGRLADIPMATNDSDNEESVPSAASAVARDDKKKLAFTTTYDGFNIWGFVLVLMVERKGGPGKKTSSKGEAHGQALMEEWIATQREQLED